MTLPLWFVQRDSDAPGSEGRRRKESALSLVVNDAGAQSESDGAYRALLLQMRSGSTEALAALMAAHVPRLALFAAAITHSRETAAEVVQDVFIRVWEQRQTLEIRGSITGYLWRATRNHALNARRHDRVVERVANEIAQLKSHDERVTHNAGANALDVESVAHDLSIVVRELPARCAEIFTLRWEQGLTAEEIAPLLGLSLSTVRSQLSRAVRHIEERLGRA